MEPFDHALEGQLLQRSRRGAGSGWAAHAKSPSTPRSPHLRSAPAPALQDAITGGPRDKTALGKSFISVLSRQPERDPNEQHLSALRNHTLHRISGRFLSSPCVLLAYPSEFDGDKVFGAQASFSLQMNISTLFLIRQECASLPSPPPYPHPLPSKLPSSCKLERKPCRIFDRLREISSVFRGVTLCLELGLVGP